MRSLFFHPRYLRKADVYSIFCYFFIDLNCLILYLQDYSANVQMIVLKLQEPGPIR